MSDSPESSSHIQLLGRWLGRLGLLLLPLLLVVGFYYRPAWQSRAPLPLDGDALFYSYQMERAGEAGGRWWTIADDDKLGQPYPTIAAKHPGIFEGVDLMLVSSLTSRVFTPIANYHFLVFLVLAVNGWVVGYLVRRYTQSYFWAAVAVILVTLNVSTAQRLNGHLHLFKHAWVALAAWAFVRFLEAPCLRRGFFLGGALALVLQSSFYIGYFVTLAFSIYGFGYVLFRGTRQHWLGGVAAGVTYASLAAALTFPVWTQSLRAPLADTYFHRYEGESSIYSSEAWQYFVSPHWKFEHRTNEAFFAPVGEGWHYPGYLVLIALAVYACARLRGWRCEGTTGRLLDVLIGLTAILVLVSLRNGPSVMLSNWVSCFRCYGRAGLASVALWSLAVPVISWALLRQVGRLWLRSLVAVAVLLLALYDGYQGQQVFYYRPAASAPAWVSWLARQSEDVRLAAFAPCDKFRKAPVNSWDWDALYYRLMHRHDTLNGCEPNLLAGDLRLLGASYETINPLGLRYIVSLGYETLAFHVDYLRANPWIQTLPWLDHIDVSADWHMYQANAKTAKLPMLPLAQLLARQKNIEATASVPPMSWITQSLDVEQPVVLGAGARARLIWANARGQTVGRPSNALFQHVYGPNIPAYTIQTPAIPGSYRLLFQDDQGHTLASKPYEVTAGLVTSRQEYGDTTPPLRVWLDKSAASGSERWRAMIDNPTGAYVQVHNDRPQVQHSIRTHAALYDLSAPGVNSLSLVVWYHRLDRDESARELRLLLPRDVPPGGRLVIELPNDLLNRLQSPGTSERQVHDEVVDVRLEQTGSVPGQ